MKDTLTAVYEAIICFIKEFLVANAVVAAGIVIMLIELAFIAFIVGIIKSFI